MPLTKSFSFYHPVLDTNARMQAHARTHPPFQCWEYVSERKRDRDKRERESDVGGPKL